MCTREGADIYHGYCVKERRTHVEVILDFSSVFLTLEQLLAIVPPVQPRYFSIASADSSSPPRHVLELCVAVVEYDTPFGRRKQGVCSTWLRSLAPGARVAMCIKPGTLRLPDDPATPVLLIGPGTGVAPMRSLLQHRAALRSAHPTADWGPCWLYFGCRHQGKDFLYQEDWARLQHAGHLTSVHTAFSRDQPEKIYVQARLIETRVAVYDALVTRRGHLYIAGSAKRMPQDVTDIVRDIFRAVGKHSEQDAKRMLAAMTREGRFVVEAWS